jgi:peptidoglycan/LPS O-acetylase OafA/YrhL
MATDRFAALDGWRAISILLVLAAHLLPLGPKPWDLNVAAGLFGMVLFFNLSGFLITHFMLRSSRVRDFLIRRFTRILPLTWLYLVMVFALYPVSSDTALAHLLFFANYPPKPLIPVTDHLWSICIEMHFYLGIALLVLLFRKSGLLLLPLFCIGFTLLRVFDGVHYSVITHYRIDEILAGAVLALIYHNHLGQRIKQLILRINPAWVLFLLLLSVHPDSGFIQYFRPYLAAMLIGITLLDTNRAPFLQHRVLAYIGTISFALYVLHPLLASTWLGNNEDFGKYVKRPLLFAVLFICAHVSTFYYERPWITFGRRLSYRFKLNPVTP